MAAGRARLSTRRAACRLVTSAARSCPVRQRGRVARRRPHRCRGSGLDPGELDVQRADTVGQLVGNLHTTQRAFLGVAAVTLLVAALGLLNIGLATVRDRTRELTIRRATEAARSRVFSLVLLSSVLLGLLAAAAALATALAVVTLVVPHVLNPASPIHAPSFPYSAGTAGLAAALAASIAGGLAPALAATRVDMAQALRT
ncbi:ABC transporter permease [Actinacidiphila soli]|uniref:ABC transporter permease n=1 Tax=Actinacidiphila soli TaxID=2487275 RepID=UPI000FC9FAD1|nr:FtsX-like permease family protein [Actinacidiphila soli]